MIIIDDPLLALIVRFVVNDEQYDKMDEEFIQRQIVALQTHVSRYPKEEQGPKAMEWIEVHAANYRREWQKKVIPHHAVEKRCPDCPLEYGNQEQCCNIHEQWLTLLKGYMEEKIDSRTYIRDALDLLQQNKEQLKVTMQHPRKRIS